MGAVTANRWAGGLSGFISTTSTARNCYNHANVRANSQYSGGLVGRLSSVIGSIYHCYSIATFSGSTTDRNGTVGQLSSGKATNTYWDRQVSSVTTNPTNTGVSRPTSSMQTQTNYEDWNFHTIWHLDACATTNDYPILRWQLVDFDETEAPTAGLGTSAAPFEISNLKQMYWLITDRKNWDKHYIQTADIDLTLTPQVCGYAYTPIGDRQDAFSGSYNGQHFKIQNLTIDVETEAFPDLGMFGVSSGTIENVLIEDVDIKGGSRIGGLLGHQTDGLVTRSGVISGTIESFVSGGASSGETGGLIGRAMKDVTQNFVKENVTVTSVNGRNTGGFMGMFAPSSAAAVEDNYSMASVVVSGTVSFSPPGAFVGRLQASGSGTRVLRRNYATGAIATGNGFIGSSATVTSSGNFFDFETTGQTTTAGTATSRTTAAMTSMSNYTAAGWDFACETANGTADIWGRNTTDNFNYPFLMWEGFVPTCIVWVGSTSTSWATSSNWDSGELPAQGDEVIFHQAAQRDLVLDQHRIVSNMDFNGSSKKVVLGDYNLTLNGDFLNSNAQSYAQTNGDGLVIVTIANLSSKLLPIGFSKLMPLEITNKTGTSDTFRIRLFDEVLENGRSGSRFIKGKGVDCTWIIEKQNPNGGDGVDLSFFWPVSALRGFGGGTPWDGNGAALYHWNSQTSNWDIYMSNISFSNPTQRNKGSFAGGVLGKVTYEGYLGSFSPFTIQDINASLPIELFEFKASTQTEGVLVEWTTLTEFNNEEFILYRSHDAKSWVEIVRLEGRQASSEKVHYQFLDQAARLGVNYFTLEQKSTRMPLKRFGVVRVLLASNTGKSSYQVMPIPSRDGNDLTLRIENDHSSEFKVGVYSVHGDRIHFFSSEELERLSNSPLTYALPKMSLRKGMYILMIESNSARIPIRFLIE